MMAMHWHGQEVENITDSDGSDIQCYSDDYVKSATSSSTESDEECDRVSEMKESYGDSCREKAFQSHQSSTHLNCQQLFEVGIFS